MKHKESKVLVLLRSPFQAWFAEKILQEKEVEIYDLIYFTHHDSEEDRFYYKRLAKNANQASFFYSKLRRLNILTELIFFWNTRKVPKSKYKYIILASIDNLIINFFSSQYNSPLITFDDGLANFYKDGPYYKEALGFRNKAYKKFLRNQELSIVKSRILNHYTFNPGLENIVQQEKIITLVEDKKPALKNLGSVKTYFIGQPLEEVMCKDSIKKIERYLKLENIDFYVKHPRENYVLNIGVPVLQKNGRIAEEAILHNAGSNPIHIISWFSTVLLNMKQSAQVRTMVLIDGDKRLDKMVELAKKSECKIVLI